MWQFAEFHRQFPEVLDEFVHECRYRMKQKRRVRAREVLVHVRRQRCLRYGRSSPPLRNDYSGYYAALAREKGIRVVSDIQTEDVLMAIDEMT